MRAWQGRPLDRCYPVLVIDAIVLKVRAASSGATGPSGTAVGNRPVYVAIGIDLDGRRDTGHAGRPARRRGRETGVTTPVGRSWTT